MAYDTTLRSHRRRQLMMLRKSTMSYMANMQSQRHLHNTKKEDLTESTGVVSAEYPLKVKLELLKPLEC